MRVTTVVFSKTKQVRPYEPERIELTIELAEGDTVQSAVEQARRTANAMLGEFGSEVEMEIKQAKMFLAEVEGPRFY